MDTRASIIKHTYHSPYTVGINYCSMHVIVCATAKLMAWITAIPY